MKPQIVRQPVEVALGDWFLEHGKDGTVLSHEVIAIAYKKFRTAAGSKLVDVTQQQLHQVIAACRVYLESKWKMTLLNVDRVGYKLADPKEKVLLTTQWMRRSIMCADRTQRLLDTNEEKDLVAHLPAAFEEVFGPNEKRIRTTANSGKSFAELYLDYTKEQRKEKLEALKNERNRQEDQKLIGHGNGSESGKHADAGVGAKAKRKPRSQGKSNGTDQEE